MKCMIKHYGGVLLIVAGTIGLASTRLHALSSSNTLLLVSLLFILAGAVVHIQSIKRESKY